MLRFDLDPAKPDALNKGESYMKQIPGARVQALTKARLLSATSDVTRLDEPEADPDLRADAAQQRSRIARRHEGLRISILLPDLRGGGAERIRLDLAHEFRRVGHEVEFVLGQARGELLTEAEASFSVVDLGASRARHVPMALAFYLRRRRCDALLAAMWPLTVSAPLARLLSGHSCRVVVSEHGMLSAQYSDWGHVTRIALRLSTAWGYRAAAERVGVSRGVSADMAALSGMAGEYFTVINNPVRPRPEPDRESLARVDALWGTVRGRRLLSVGRFKAVKNHALLLRAFALLPTDARLMLLGDGELGGSLRRLSRELGLGDRVIFPGFYADPTPFYRTADLLVLSSDREGFGNVIVEAMACGTPVVSTDCPSGPAEILEGGRYGRLTPVGDPAALAEAIEETLRLPLDRDILRLRAAEFSLPKAAQRYLELLSGE